DAVEHLDGGVGLGNVTCTERARHGLTSFDRKGERRGFGLEISHGAARSRAVGNPSYHERPLWLYPRGKPPRLVATSAALRTSSRRRASTRAPSVGRRSARTASARRAAPTRAAKSSRCASSIPSR